jgi:hypothetical protein
LSNLLSSLAVNQAPFRLFDAFAIAVIKSDRHIQGYKLCHTNLNNV